MQHPTLTLLLVLTSLSLQAQVSNTIRIDSVSPSQWYFVRSTVTVLPDSSRVVDEQWKYFKSARKARTYVRELYAVELAQDSVRLALLQTEIEEKKKERREILRRGGGGNSAPRSASPPPSQPATVTKKKKQ
jgi:hypothetical protein